MGNPFANEPSYEAPKTVRKRLQVLPAFTGDDDGEDEAGLPGYETPVLNETRRTTNERQHNRGETISGIGINNVEANRSNIGAKSRNIVVNRSDANYNNINSEIIRNHTRSNRNYTGVNESYKNHLNNCMMWKGMR